MYDQDGNPVVVYLGNRDAHEIRVVDEATGRRAAVALEPGRRSTKFGFPEHWDLAEVVDTVKTGWPALSAGSPAWVASTDAALGALLANHYQCELREVEV